MKQLTPVLFLALAVCVIPARADWRCDWFHINCPVVNTFTPVYETAPVLLSPFHAPTPLNPWYFATADTAATVCKLLGCQFVYEQNPCDLGGGPNTCSVTERILAFPTGNKNAGFLAAYWTRNPDGQFPGVALSLAKADLLQ